MLFKILVVRSRDSGAGFLATCPAGTAVTAVLVVAAVTDFDRTPTPVPVVDLALDSDGARIDGGRVLTGCRGAGAEAGRVGGGRRRVTGGGAIILGPAMVVGTVVRLAVVFAVAVGRTRDVDLVRAARVNEGCVVVSESAIKGRGIEEAYHE